MIGGRGRRAVVGGASAPTLSDRISAIRHESVGAEAPPTTAERWLAPTRRLGLDSCLQAPRPHPSCRRPGP
ncbi:DUF6053 domain-containing protein [Lysobacter enzymogenes]|uniref:DUF6053 domain-containing protein n=1 Tax=Lysobacter enzymogenes TaxID=69 RepID=UPI003D18BDC6